MLNEGTSLGCETSSKRNGYADYLPEPKRRALQVPKKCHYKMPLYMAIALSRKAMDSNTPLLLIPNLNSLVRFRKAPRILFEQTA